MNTSWRNRSTTLENECSAIEAQIADLRGLLHQKKCEMNRFSPIQTLSDDILYAIFEAAYLHHFPHCRLYSGLPEDSPMVVTHVSKRWRQLALQLPSIWSCLHVTAEQTMRKGYIDVIRTFIQRSKTRLLSAMFICHNSKFAFSHGLSMGEATARHNAFRTHWPRFFTCWKAILAQHLRLRHLAVYCSYDKNLLHLCTLFNSKGSFPALKSLQVLQDYSIDVDEITYPLEISAPRLRHLRAHVVQPAVSSIYDRLTELTLDNFPTELPAILEHVSSTLERLVLRMVFLRSTTARPQLRESLTLPRLRYLGISSHVEEEAEDVEDNTPLLTALLRAALNLETFHLTTTSQYFDVFETASRSPISFRSLRSMMLHFDDEDSLPRESWSPFTTAIPAVEDLHIFDVAASKCLSTVAETSIDSHVEWPKLHALAISVLTAEELEAVAAFLRHRVEIQHPLEGLTLMCSSKDHAQLSQHWGAEADRPVVQWKLDQALYDPFDPWDTSSDRPSFTSWDESLEFVDQDV